MNRRIVRALFWIACSALLIALIAYARTVQETRQQDRSKKGAPAAVPVSTALAARKPMPIVAAGIGNVTPIYSVVVKARVDGQLQKVAFVEGQNVKTGDLLAQIDPRPFAAQLAQFEAQKVRDQAQLDNGVLDLERYATLLKEDSIARQQFDTQRATVEQLKAAIQLDQAQIDNARVQLDYTTIRAPIAGRTGVRLVDPGNIVHAADANGLVTINQIDPISVLFTLPEDQFQHVMRGQTEGHGQPLSVEAHGRGDSALLATGKLTLVNNQIDSATGTFQLRAVFPNAKSTLWPGQYVNVRVVLEVVPDAVTIPEAAVQRSQQGLYVYVVKPDGTAGVQPVELRQSEGGTAMVTRGLAGGERIVVDGQYKLKPGATVVEATHPGSVADSSTSSARPAP